MSKVIDITQRIREKTLSNVVPSASFTETEDGVKVSDITEVRQEMIRRERREARRTILTEFVGAFVILPERGLLKVSLYDISESGLAFDIEVDQGSFANNEEVAMRVYLNKSTYFPFNVIVTNGRLIENEGVVRHGASIVTGSVNEVALYHFIRFIESVSVNLRKDEGDLMAWNIS